MSLINGTFKQWCQRIKNIPCKLFQTVWGESTVKCFYALLSLKTMIPVYLDHITEFPRGISAGNIYILEMLLLFLLLLMLFFPKQTPSVWHLTVDGQLYWDSTRVSDV